MKTLLITQDEKLPYITHSTKYLNFIITRFKPKTMVIAVVNKKSGDELGRIEWYAGWRQYCFMPHGNTVWNTNCLCDIQNFINILMLKHVPKPQVVGILCKNLQEFLEWSETKHKRSARKYGGSRRIYTHGKTKYVGLSHPNHCLGLKLNKIIETNMVQQNKNYQMLLRNARMCLNR